MVRPHHQQSALVAISIPSFWFAIMLIILFSLNLGWLPSSGMRTTGIHTFWDLARHAIMPCWC